MTDRGTIHLGFGHHQFHFPLAYVPLEVKCDVVRGPSNGHCGHNPHQDKIDMTIEGRGISIRAHVQEEYITLHWEARGDFIPESIDLK